MSRPTIESRGNIFNFTWKDELLTVKVSRLATHSDRTTCEILFETTDPTWDKHLFQTHFNLTTTTPAPRNNLAKELFRVYGEVLDEQRCRDIVEQLCVKTLELYRLGEPVVELMTSDEIQPTLYKVYPMVAENESNVIFGEGGSGKSFVAMILTIVIQLPWINNTLGFKDPRPGRVLWLDWETSENTARKNLKLLTRGFDLPDFFITYRRCSQSLTSDLEAIQNLCLEHKIDTVIIDSAGLACGGDMNKAEPVNDFFRALRSLNVTSIIISHMSKQEMKFKGRKKTPIGSIYFFNMPRNIFECRSVQEPGSNLLTIGLFHNKCNINRFSPPLAYTLTFAEDEIIVTQDDPKAIPEFTGEMPLSSQILDTLKSERDPLTRAEITAIIGAKEDSVKRTLTRLHNQHKIVSLPSKKWGQAYHD